MGNEVLNIFLFNKFFEKKNYIFGENEEKKFLGMLDHFLGEELILRYKRI